MVEEMAILHSTSTWDLVTLLINKSHVGCRGVYIVKIGPDGRVDRLKVRLVAKGYTQIYASDYYDTFSCWQDDFRSSSPIYGCYEILAPISVGHQECLSPWRPHRRGIYGATTWFCCLRGVGLVCKLHRSLYGLK